MEPIVEPTKLLAKGTTGAIGIEINCICGNCTWGIVTIGTIWGIGATGTIWDTWGTWGTWGVLIIEDCLWT